MTPAWHDVPPVPGEYQIRYIDGTPGAALTVGNPLEWARTPYIGRKLYGPLPEPPPIPKPPNPPRMFRCSIEGITRFGVLFDSGLWWTFSVSGEQIFCGSGGKCSIVGDCGYTDIEFFDGAPA